MENQAIFYNIEVYFCISVLAASLTKMVATTECPR